MERHLLHKNSGKCNCCAVCGCGPIIRNFMMDDNELQQYKNDKAKKPTKTNKFAQSRCELHDFKTNKKGWHDKKHKSRVAIYMLRDKKKKDVFVYSDDINYLKALMVRVKIAGGDGSLKSKLKSYMAKISLISQIQCFQDYWKRMNDLQKKRIVNMIAFNCVS